MQALPGVARLRRQADTTRRNENPPASQVVVELLNQVIHDRRHRAIAIRSGGHGVRGDSALTLGAALLILDEIRRMRANPKENAVDQ